MQTVTYSDNPNLHSLLAGFFERTGCPMLLNTSLNIKGEPLVNSWDDAVNFSDVTGVSVF